MIKAISQARKGERAILAMIVAAGAGAVPLTTMAETIPVRWAAPVSGDWYDPALWDALVVPRNGTPNPGDTYDVTIDAIGAEYVVQFDDAAGRVQLDGLSLASPNATLRLIRGDLHVARPIDVSAGTLEIVRWSDLTHGGLKSVILTGSGGQIVARGGSFDDVTVRGREVLVKGSIEVHNDLTLDGGIVNIRHEFDHSPTALKFEGNQIIGGQGEIRFTMPNRYNNQVRPTGGGALTLSEMVHTRAIDGHGTFDIYAGDVINRGTVSTEGTGIIEIRGMSTGPLMHHFENEGLVIANDSGTVFMGSHFINRGTIRAEGESTIYLGAGGGGPDLRTEQIGAVQARDRGRIILSCPLDNAGQTLAVSDDTGDLHFQNASVTGGTLATSGAARFVVLGGGYKINAATLAGQMVVHATNPSSGSTLEIHNGLTLDDGTLTFVAPNASLYSYEDQSIHGTGEIRIEGESGQARLFLFNDSTLTLEEGITLRAKTRGVAVGNAGSAVVNRGRIVAEAPGQTLSVSGLTNHGAIEARDGGIVHLLDDFTNRGAVTIGPASTLALLGNWDNLGSITSDDGNVQLGGSFTLTKLGTFDRTGGTVTLVGALDNSAGTLALNATTGDWQLGDNGAIRGGHITAADGTELVAVGNSTLDGVTLASDLVLRSAMVTATGSLTLDGSTIRLEKPQSSRNAVFSIGAPSIEGVGLIRFDARFGSAGTVGPVPGGSGLTIGSGITIRTGTSGGTVGTFDVDLLNRGTIIAEGGNKITLRGNTFTNEGTITVRDRATLDLSVTDWENPGVVSITGATVTIRTPVTTADIERIQRSNATIGLDATLDNTGATLLLDPAGTSGFILDRAGRITGGSVVALGNASLVASGTNVLDDVTLDADLKVWLGARVSFPAATSRIRREIVMESMGSAASVEFAGIHTLTGGGAIVFEGGSGQQNFVRGTSATGGRITVASDFSIRTGDGGGQVTGVADLVNLGTISARTPGRSIAINTRLANAGLVEATGGGQVTIHQLDADTFDDRTLRQGTWHVGPASKIRFTLSSPSATRNAAAVTLQGVGSEFPLIDALDHNTGSFTVTDGRHFTTLGDLANDGTIKIGPNGVLRVNGSFTNAGTIDVSGRLRLAAQTPEERTSLLTAYEQLVQLARGAQPPWPDSGLTSSAARSDPLTGLAVGITGGDVSVIFTYNGDANLDGVINADDYFRIDSGFLAQPSDPLYSQGDFNYDGQINADDYFLIDSAFLGQGQPLGGLPEALALATAPVPEPGALLAIGAALSVLVRRPSRA